MLGFVFLIFRGLMIAADAPTVFTRLLAGAITLSFFTYAFVNMGMVSGILPVVGVPLPFISYGGTAMVSLGLGLGPADVHLEKPPAGAELRPAPGEARTVKERAEAGLGPAVGQVAAAGVDIVERDLGAVPRWRSRGRSPRPSQSRRRRCRASGRTGGTPARARPEECRGRSPRPAAPPTWPNGSSITRTVTVPPRGV